jgi:hypothetical protein
MYYQPSHGPLSIACMPGLHALIIVIHGTCSSPNDPDQTLLQVWLLAMGLGIFPILPYARIMAQTGEGLCLFLTVRHVLNVCRCAC